MPIPENPSVNIHLKPGPLRVGVFDSGVGGLSVLPALRQRLPHAELIYVADSGYAPYGERDDAWLQHRCGQVVDFLRGQGAQLLLVACNTATAAALPWLRAQHPGTPIVGMEPGIKPAVRDSRSKRVGVLATATTLRSQRWQALLAVHGLGAHVVTQACDGLALAIEHGDGPAIETLVDRYTQPMRDADVDCLVLGCTHYAFARAWIQKAMGTTVSIIDTAQAVARRAASLMPPARDHTRASSKRCQSVEFWTTGAPKQLEGFAQHWLSWTISAQSLTPLPSVGQASGPAAATAGPG